MEQKENLEHNKLSTKHFTSFSKVRKKDTKRPRQSSIAFMKTLGFTIQLPVEGLHQSLDQL